MQNHGSTSRQLRMLPLVSCLTMAMLFISMQISAQGRFFFVTESRSTNLWSAFVGGTIAANINKLITKEETIEYHQSGGWYSESLFGDLKYRPEIRVSWVPGIAATFYRWNEMKNYGSKIETDNFRFFGFKAVDLFRDFEYSLKFGWQPQQIPVGFYAKIGYKHENFNSRIDENSNWTKHRINTFRPGLGIKVSPLENLLGNKAFCPVFEIGSTYNYHFNYKGGMNSDVKELNNGISAHIAVGAKMKSGTALFLRFEKDTYDLFNKDYTVNGVKPYEGYTTNRCNLTFSIDVGL